MRTVPAALQADAYELTAMAYQACSAALVKLASRWPPGWPPTGRWRPPRRPATCCSPQPGQYRLASVFLDASEFALADEMARTSLIALRGLAELGDPDALSLCGGLTLLRAVDRGQDAIIRRAAFGHLAKAGCWPAGSARQQANGMPEFGAQYVALYEIAVSVDLGDAGHALRTAASLDIAGLSPGRQARMLIDVARAYALRGQVDEATAALLRAVELGPAPARDATGPVSVIRRSAGRQRCPPPARWWRWPSRSERARTQRAALFAASVAADRPAGRGARAWAG